MWDISANLGYPLPEGYSLKSDPEFVYLFRMGELITTFTVHADPKEIIKEVESDLERISKESKKS